MCVRDSIRGLPTAIGLLLLFTVPVTAEVVFYLERHGSADDTGHADFCLAVGDYAEQDFEDPLLGPDFTKLPALPIGDVQLALSSAFPDGTPFEAFVFSSAEFDVEGRIHNRTMVAATSLTLTPPATHDLLAFGAWIFDDGSLQDSGYLFEVTETDGGVWQVILENEIPPTGYGHEIEGFVGVVSNVGISQIVIMAIDPATGELLPDIMEIDHVKAVTVAAAIEEEDDGKKRHKEYRKGRHPRKHARKHGKSHPSKHESSGRRDDDDQSMKKGPDGESHRAKRNNDSKAHRRRPRPAGAD